jgi:hypothetical protein
MPNGKFFKTKKHQVGISLTEKQDELLKEVSKFFGLSSYTAVFIFSLQILYILTKLISKENLLCLTNTKLEN